MNKNAAFFEKCRKLPILYSLDKWSELLYITDTLLSLDTSAQEVMTKMSTVIHLDAVLSLSVPPTMGKGAVVDYYYGSLKFANMTRER